jgi:hypothetical protein
MILVTMEGQIGGHFLHSLIAEILEENSSHNPVPKLKSKEVCTISPLNSPFPQKGSYLTKLKSNHHAKNGLTEAYSSNKNVHEIV